MSIRIAAAVAVLTLSAVQLAASPARADDLCRSGHVLDSNHGMCYDPATAYRPNVPQQQSLFGSGPAAADPKPQDGSAQSSDGIFGWFKDQARFCRFGDRQVGSGDAAYCVDRGGKSYPAGK